MDFLNPENTSKSIPKNNEKLKNLFNNWVRIRPGYPPMSNGSRELYSIGAFKIKILTVTKEKFLFCIFFKKGEREKELLIDWFK